MRGKAALAVAVDEYERRREYLEKPCWYRFTGIIPYLLMPSTLPHSEKADLRALMLFDGFVTTGVLPLDKSLCATAFDVRQAVVDAMPDEGTLRAIAKSFLRMSDDDTDDVAERLENWLSCNDLMFDDEYVSHAVDPVVWIARGRVYYFVRVGAGTQYVTYFRSRSLCAALYVMHLIVALFPKLDNERTTLEPLRMRYAPNATVTLVRKTAVSPPTARV